jgi:hypothetical protein
MTDYDTNINDLNRNWKFILNFHKENYNLDIVFQDDDENIIILDGDNQSCLTIKPYFVVAYLHLFNGDPYYMAEEINLFASDIRKYIENSKWDMGPFLNETKDRFADLGWNDSKRIFEIRFILNFSLGELVNSGFVQIPKDIKYFLITECTVTHKITMTPQDLILESIKSNNLTYNRMFNSNNPRKNIDNGNDQYWSCNICDGDSETGCLFFDPSECPKFT